MHLQKPSKQMFGYKKGDFQWPKNYQKTLYLYLFRICYKKTIRFYNKTN